MLNTQPYADLEIRILDRQDAGYPVEITLNDGQEFPRGFLAADVLSRTSTGDLRADGERLFAALFSDVSLRTAWDRVLGRYTHRRIRLRLDTTVPELHILPWELLHDGQAFLAADARTPFSRYLPSDLPWSGLVDERPIRILAVISNPTDLASQDLTPLDEVAERELLRAALGNLIPAHFCLEYLEAPVTLDRLARALASGPHVLHYVGHGAFNMRRQETILYLQDAAGLVQPVTDAQLDIMLRRQVKLPSLIFLSACQSAERSMVDALVGLAPKLVQAGIPAVVAMQDNIAIAATRKLSSVFYEELARHGEIDRALNAARNLLLTDQLPDAGVPVLLMRLTNAKVWEPLWAKTNPYRGLAAFTETDAEFFFGRESLIRELSEKVRRQRFIAVVGPSGSGKSSVVQAGLLPKLSKNWQIVKLRPGSDPYANKEWQIVNSEWRILNDEQSADPLLRRSVLIIDQFEELFALCSPEVQMRFLADLETLIVCSAPVTVILTLRADFYGHIQNSPLGKYLEHAVANVLPMESDDLRVAIERPAQQVGLRFEVGLVDTLTQDAQSARHTLPLLQFTLTQLWERQSQGMLTHKAYKVVGGVAGSIGLWAEDTYNNLTDAERQLARRVFTRLVHYGEGDMADTRQRRSLPDLLAHPDEHDALHLLLQRLASKRLLTTDEAQGVEFVEIIHDALFKEWFHLEQWLTEQREFYLWRQRLEAQVRLWEQKGRDDGALLRGALLTEAERWLQEKPEELNEQEQIYIRTGVDRRELEQQAQELRRRRILAGTVTAAVLLLILAVVAVMGWRSSTTKEQARATAQAEAVLEAARALNAEATAQAEAIHALNAEATAEARRQDAENAYATAESRRIEAEDAQATAEVERSRAEQQARLALSGKLVANSQSLIDEQLDLSLLLSVEALDIATTTQARGNLLAGIEHSPHIIRFLHGHTDSISGVAFSPDGKILATAGCAARDSTGISCIQSEIRLWNTMSGYPIGRPLIRDTNSVGQSLWIAFSPLDNGQILIAVGSDGHITLWDVNSGRQLGDYMANHIISWRVSGVAFSPDGKILATGGCAERDQNEARAFCSQGEIGLWDIENRQPIEQPLKGHGGWVEHLAFSPDNRTLATAGPPIEEFSLGLLEEIIILWDVASKQPSYPPLEVHTRPITALTFNPDGKTLASGSCSIIDANYHCIRGEIWLWDVVDRQSLGQPIQGHTDNVGSIAFNTNGTIIASGSWDGTIILWDVEKRRPIGESLKGHIGSVKDMAFSPDGTALVSVSTDKMAILWDMTSEQPLAQPFPVQPKYGQFVRSLAFSPDSQMLASGDSYGDIYLWNVYSRQLAGNPLVGHEKGVQQILFSTDGKTLVSGSQDKNVILWDVTHGQVISQPVVSLTCAAFSPDGKTLVSTSTDKTINLWDITNGQVVSKPYTNHSDQVINQLIFSPDSKIVASISRENVIDLWNVASGQLMKQPFLAYTGTVHSLVFSPDSSILALGGCRKQGVNTCIQGNIYLWDIVSGNPMGQPLVGHTGGIRALTFSPDSQLLASGGFDKTVLIWDVPSGQLLYSLPVAEFCTGLIIVEDLVFTPDGRIVLANCFDDTTILWDVLSGKVVQQLPAGVIGNSSTGIALSPDGKLLVSGQVNSNIIVWDLVNDQSISRTLGGYGSSFAFSSDSKVLATGSESTIVLWDMASSQPIGDPLIGHADTIISLGFSPDDKTLMSLSRDNTVNIWDVSSGQLISQPVTGYIDQCRNMAFSPDGTIMASSSCSIKQTGICTQGEIRFWNLKTGHSLGLPLRFQVSKYIYKLAFSPDGNILVSAYCAELDKEQPSGTCTKSAIRLWDLDNAKPIGQPLIFYAGEVNALAFSLNGIILASGSNDNINLWNVTASQSVGQPLIGPVESLAFSPDNQTMASAKSGAIMLWDGSGQPIGPSLVADTGIIYSLAFSPDGKTLASGDNNGKIILWDTDPASWKSRACRIANRNLTPEEWKTYLGDEPYRVTCSNLPVLED